jgi:hypothetical protein
MMIDPIPQKTPITDAAQLGVNGCAFVFIAIFLGFAALFVFTVIAEVLNGLFGG